MMAHSMQSPTLQPSTLPVLQQQTQAQPLQPPTFEQLLQPQVLRPQPQPFQEQPQPQQPSDLRTPSNPRLSSRSQSSGAGALRTDVTEAVNGDTEEHDWIPGDDPPSQSSQPSNVAAITTSATSDRDGESKWQPRPSAFASASGSQASLITMEQPLSEQTFTGAPSGMWVPRWQRGCAPRAQRQRHVSKSAQRCVHVGCSRRSAQHARVV